jgi:hypothetical protein
VRVEAPGQYGHSHIQTLNVSIDVTSRLTAWRSTPASPLPPPPGTLRYLEAPEWAALLDAMMATLTDPRVARRHRRPRRRGSHPGAAAQGPAPRQQPRDAGFLPPQLRPISDASGSHGAHLQADPALSLADPEDRARQVTRWCQIAADAGLTGMESLVTQLPPFSSECAT